MKRKGDSKDFWSEFWRFKPDDLWGLIGWGAGIALLMWIIY